MGLIDILIIAVVGICFVFAAIYVVKQKKNNGGCCGDCSHCGGSCQNSKINRRDGK